MDTTSVAHNQSILNDGFTVIDAVYTGAEVKSILAIIAGADQSNPAFRKTDDLFAIRQFLKELPQVVPLIFMNG
jgi:hypothetical protein